MFGGDGEVKISRIDAIKIIERATDKEDPYWDQVTEDWYDEDKDVWPSIFDVYMALGITNEELKTVSSIGYPDSVLKEYGQ